MKLEIAADAETAAARAADLIAGAVRRAVAGRGRCVMAVSGGATPWRMLVMLAGRNLPWPAIHLVQVDERVAPDGDAERNLSGLRQSLGPVLPSANLHAMPVNLEDPEPATAYAAILAQLCGTPPILDLIHLGLGDDGHTASLVPGDPVLTASAEVAFTGCYRGRRRMTLTYPVLNRAREIVWLVTGRKKAPVLPRLLAGDPAIPAGRVNRRRARIVADADAASLLSADWVTR